MRHLLHGIILEGDTNDPDQEMKPKKELIFWRIILEDKIQGKVQFKSSIYLKLQI